MESISGSSSNPQCMLFPWTGREPQGPGVRRAPAQGCAEPGEGQGAGWGGRAEADRGGGGGERGRGGHSVIQQGKARPVKMFADVSWEKASFYRSPDGRNVIDRPASLMNGCYSDGDVARLNVKPIVMLF